MHTLNISFTVLIRNVPALAGCAALRTLILSIFWTDVPALGSVVSIIYI